MRATTYRNWAIVTVILTYATILVGGFTRGSGAGLGCGDDWPLCQGQVFPTWSNELMVIEWSHRYVAMMAGIAILAVATMAWARYRRDRPILWTATIAGVLLPFQALLGREVVENALSPALSALHMGVAAGLFGAVVALAIFAWQRAEPGATDAPEQPTTDPDDTNDAPRTRASLSSYVHILRPRMHTLLILVALMAMAVGGDVDWVRAAIVALGGSLAIGGASAINAYIERDSDARMGRTKDRIQPHGDVPAAHALGMGIALVLAGVMAMAAFVNILAATLTLGAAAYYLFVYTVLLKPNTHHNTVIGGVAGAIPPLVGWAAATGGLSLSAFALAGVLFAWQPAHFWALALHHRDDYARARIPMLPVVKGRAATKRAIVLWTLWTMVAAALLVEPLGVFGGFYFAASTVLGLAFLGMALHTRFGGDERAPLRTFHFSIAYLALLFVAMAVDKLVF